MLKKKNINAKINSKVSKHRAGKHQLGSEILCISEPFLFFEIRKERKMMLKFDLDKFKEGIQKADDVGRIEMTEGMKYIDAVLTSREVIMTDQVDYTKFSYDDLEKYRSIWEDIQHVNSKNSETAKKVHSIEPKRPKQELVYF